jgi:hypothetical protein
LPVAVILNRLATAFLVLRRAMDLGMGRGMVQDGRGLATLFCAGERSDVLVGGLEYRIPA